MATEIGIKKEVIYTTFGFRIGDATFAAEFKNPKTGEVSEPVRKLFGQVATEATFKNKESGKEVTTRKVENVEIKLINASKEPANEADMLKKYDGKWIQGTCITTEFNGKVFYKFDCSLGQLTVTDKRP